MPPEDHEAIAAAIVDLVRDAGARQQLRDLGFERARSLSLEKMARGTLEVYRALL